MLSDIGDISSIQADGAAPSVLVAGRAAGESGVQVVKLKYQGAAHFAASLHQHVITFMSQGPVYCRVAGKALSHEAQEGSLAVLPAGIDAACDRSADATSLLICVEPGRLALAAAEESAFAAKLVDRMTGYDANLLHLGRLLIEECAADYPRGALFWNEAAHRFWCRSASSIRPVFLSPASKSPGRLWTERCRATSSWRGSGAAARANQSDVPV